MNEPHKKQKILFEIVIILAVLVFVGIAIFWRTSGTRYVKDDNHSVISTDAAMSTPFALATYSSGRFGVSFAYPEVFVVGKPEENTVGWRFDATTTGTLATKISIPASLEMQTNFAGASFTVGFSRNSDSIATCLQKGSPATEVASVDIGGIPFSRFHYTDAGAGNFYEVTSYRTIYNDRCYAVETVIHTTNIANYSPDQNIHEFNREQVQQILDTMVESFRFR